MPGHKGRPVQGTVTGQIPLLASDLTELPGLDDLSYPHGTLAKLEERAARLWSSQASLISTQGATSAMLAALMAVSGQRQRILIARNAHRSVINGLVLSGLEPVWFDPQWDADWGVWGRVDAQSLSAVSATEWSQMAAVVLVSPTYAGALSDIAAVSELCHRHSVPLIVDEAHGAHLFTGTERRPPTIALSDITIHSLHKTLPCLTQTGLLHVNSQLLDKAQLQRALQLVHTSSPSYALLLSIDHTVSWLETEAGRCSLTNIYSHSQRLKRSLQELGGFEIYQPASATDPAHILLRPLQGTASELMQFLSQRGIFAEALLGHGLLLLLGAGSESEDIDLLLEVLQAYLADRKSTQPRDSGHPFQAQFPMPPAFQQVVSPRQAFFMPSEVIPLEEAVGRISQECIAPCPPGIPVCVPGQRVHPEVMSSIDRPVITVVKN